MGVGAEPADVLHRVAGRLAGTESRAGDIYGIGTAVNGCDADICIPCRSKQLKLSHAGRLYYWLRALTMSAAWA